MGSCWWHFVCDVDGHLERATLWQSPSKTPQFMVVVLVKTMTNHGFSPTMCFLMKRDFSDFTQKHDDLNHFSILSKSKSQNIFGWSSFSSIFNRKVPSFRPHEVHVLHRPALREPLSSPLSTGDVVGQPLAQHPAGWIFGGVHVGWGGSWWVHGQCWWFVSKCLNVLTIPKGCFLYFWTRPESCVIMENPEESRDLSQNVWNLL